MQKISLKISQKNKLKKILAKHKTYKSLSSKRTDAYEFTSTLGLRVCPYCNIHFTYTVYADRKYNKGLVLRPDIDHFTPKSEAANLQLHRTNLIPSCLPCNQRIKGKKLFKRYSHIHPLLDDFNSIKRFSIDLLASDYTKIDSFKIIFKNHASASIQDKKKADNSIKDLSLNSRYQYHKEDAVDLFRRAKFYHKAKIKEFEDIFGHSEIKKSIFPDRTTDINSKPLAKLSNDILDLIL